MMKKQSAENKNASRTQTLYRHAKERIPGGTQLLSKRPEMLAPDQWPPYYRKASGCEIWDLDNRHYYDFSTNGIGSCLLGFNDPDVTRAVCRRVRSGSMCTLNPPEEVALADRLCAIHPWADQARFARCGGEACAVAVRIARATTDRSVVAICGYSGWQDWYLAANLGDSDALRGHLLPGLSPLGVPRELRGTTVPFTFDNREQFNAILEQYGPRLAAVVMEPCRSQDPAPGFLEFVKAGAHRVGALLIFDEITIGWRLHFGGAHLKFGVSPDLAVFAKALGNGHPMASVIGTRAAMAGAHDSFISSTYWTEGVGRSRPWPPWKRCRPPTCRHTSPGSAPACSRCGARAPRGRACRSMSAATPACRISVLTMPRRMPCAPCSPKACWRAASWPAPASIRPSPTPRPSWTPTERRSTASLRKSQPPWQPTPSRRNCTAPSPTAGSSGCCNGKNNGMSFAAWVVRPAGGVG